MNSVSIVLLSEYDDSSVKESRVELNKFNFKKTFTSSLNGQCYARLELLTIFRLRLLGYLL